jgi:hypothetical protein
MFKSAKNGTDDPAVALGRHRIYGTANKVGRIMPVLMGMILGVAITIFGAYAYDATSGRAPNGLPPSAANGHPPMVNWDVVGDNWRDARTHLGELAGDVERGWKRLTS